MLESIKKLTASSNLFANKNGGFTRTSVPVTNNFGFGRQIVNCTSSREDGLVTLLDDDSQNVDKKEDTPTAQVTAANAASEAPKTEAPKTESAEAPKETEKTSSETTETDGRRYVTVDSKSTEAQQAQIDSVINQVIAKDYGISGLKIADDVTYQDENGNPLKRVVIKEGDNGQKVSVTVVYDEKGRVSSISTQADLKDGIHSWHDGDRYSFTYDGNGYIYMQPENGWGDDNADGCHVTVQTFRLRIRIAPDGTVYHERMPGLWDSFPYLGILV